MTLMEPGCPVQKNGQEFPDLKKLLRRLDEAAGESNISRRSQQKNGGIPEGQ
jgi:hypothetical protein